MRLISHSVAFVVLVVASPDCSQSAPPQDFQQVIQPVVRPFEVDGQAYGCELSFHIARGPRQGEWTDAIGATLAIVTPEEGYWAATLKVGYQAGTPRVTPPTSAALQFTGGTNASELLQSEGPNEHGYMLLIFRPGPNTRSAFAELSETGELGFSIGVAEGQNQIFRLNLNEHPAARSQWDVCVRSYPIFASE